MGVNVSDLLETMQVFYGSSFVSDFNRFGKYYRVMAQADAEYRNNPESLTYEQFVQDAAREFKIPLLVQPDEADREAARTGLRLRVRLFDGRPQ